MRSDPEERPFCVQLFGSDPVVMAKAAEKVVQAGADAIDINMGCPARKVVKTGSGGALLLDWRKAERIVRAVRRVCPLPLTVKIRAGWSPVHGSPLDWSRPWKTAVQWGHGSSPFCNPGFFRRFRLGSYRPDQIEAIRPCHRQRRRILAPPRHQDPGKDRV